MEEEKKFVIPIDRERDKTVQCGNMHCYNRVPLEPGQDKSVVLFCGDCTKKKG